MKEVVTLVTLSFISTTPVFLLVSLGLHFSCSQLAPNAVMRIHGPDQHNASDRYQSHFVGPHFAQRTQSLQ